MKYRRGWHKKNVVFVLLILLFTLPLGAGEIFLSRMELYTLGVPEDGRFKLQSSGGISLELTGGYKVAASLGLRLDSSSFETSPADFLRFQYASLGIRDIFGIPLDLSYFLGEGDFFCNGVTFGREFGASPFASRFLDINGEPKYRGLFRISGTGLILSSDFGGDFSRLFFYTYQDNYQGGDGRFTSALRGLWDWEKVKIEAFFAASYPVSDAGVYSGGILFLYRPGERGEFFAQVGIPRWDPVQDKFDAELFYFLFEPRLNLGIFSLVPTFFMRPGYYLAGPTNEGGVMDINLGMQLGKPQTSPFCGGLDTTVTLTPEAGIGDKFFKLALSPYVGVLTSGIVWDFRLKFNVVKTDSQPLFMAIIGIKAEF